MPSEFDISIDRAGSDSIKWSKYAGRDVLPMWIADMDFAAPPAVLDAIRRRLDHGVLGYPAATKGQVAAVVDYLHRHYGWDIDPAWIVWLPGLVTGLNVACRAVGTPGDAVFTATPIYPPFLSAPRNAGRRVARCDLVRDERGWLWDFAAVDAALAESRARLFLLCHPHNPTGRIWDADEMAQIAALAEKHDLVVCSDEIHAGLALDPSARHVPFAVHAPRLAARTITLMAPSKAFNMPGMGASFAIVPDATLRRAVHAAAAGLVPDVNVLGMAALEAALTACDDWLVALRHYLAGNARAVLRAVDALPALVMHAPEASYLAWIDARGMGVDAPVASFEAHGLGLSDGADFGMPGFVRLNFGTQRARLDDALTRLARAVTTGASA